MHAGNQWKVYEVAKRRNTIAALEARALKTMTRMMIKETRKCLQSDNGGKMLIIFSLPLISSIKHFSFNV
ncbi:UNVERIFIED_CONTAM: hypothetical protein Sangu_3068000, partial [Sesamum angustifolium]